MTEPLGDLAERVAKKMVTDVSAPVQEAAAITEESALLADNNIFTKIKFSWSPEDRAILERIRMSADAIFEEAFTASIEAIDWFYLQLRVPKTKEGQVLTGADGRTIWETDQFGRPVEDWNQLTGTDVEKTLADLARLRFYVAPQVNQLMLDALYARHTAQDTHDEAWAGLMDGTQGDKSARSNRDSRVDRYHSYFRFCLYSVAKTFLDEIDAFTKLLTNVRYWGVRSQKG